MRLSLIRSAALVAFCTLNVGLMATPAMAGNGKKEIALLPKAASGVLVINVEQLVASALWKELFAMAATHPAVAGGLNEVKAKLGFDPLKAIRTLTVAVPSDLSKKDGLIIVEGTFDAAKLTTMIAQTDSAKQVTHEGAVIFVSPQGEGLCAMSNQILLGDVNAVKAALTAAKGKTKGTSVLNNAAVTKALSDVKNTSDVYGAVLLAAKDRKMMGPDAQGLSGLRGTIDMEKGLVLRAVMSFDKATEAQAVAAKVLTSITEMSQDPQAKMMGIDALAKKVKAQAKGNEVKFDIVLDEADITRIKGMASMMMMMMGGQGGGAPGGPPPGMAPLISPLPQGR